MPRLSPCPSCHSHVLADERACPHCGASLRKPKARASAVLVGLALTGCPQAEPAYGVPDTGPSEEDSESDSESGMDTGMETGMDAGTETSGAETDTGDGGETVGEPEYGVPDTGA